MRKNEHGIVIICIYVDDLIAGGDNEVEIVPWISYLRDHSKFCGNNSREQVVHMFTSSHVNKIGG